MNYDREESERVQIDKEPLTNGSSVENETSKSMWSLEYYQQFFEVTTDQVLNRATWSMFPKPGLNYFKCFIKAKPDLYGPFWICLTLVLTVAMAGNVGHYLYDMDKSGKSWKYDFHFLTFSSILVFSYCWLLPIVLWGVLKFSSEKLVILSYLDLVCMYGYCVTIFIPVSFMWIIQISWLQWSMLIISSLLSGAVLLQSLIPIVGPKNYLFLAILSLLHFLLPFSLMISFFRNVHTESENDFNGIASL